MTEESNIKSPKEIDERKHQQIMESAWRIVHTSEVGPIHYIQNEDEIDCDFPSLRAAIKKATAAKMPLCTNTFALSVFDNLYRHLLFNNSTFNTNIKGEC